MPIVTTSTKGRKKPKFLPYLLFVAILATGVAAALVYKPRKPVEETATAPEQEAKPSPPVAATIEPKTGTLAEIPSNDPPPSSPKELDFKVHKGSREGYWLMPDGKEHKFTLPKEGETVSKKYDGKLYRIDSEGNYTDITKPKIFDTPLENQLIGLSTEKGSFAPGFLLRHSDGEIIEALKKPVEIYDDDSEQVRFKKEAVAIMKQEILAYIEQGGTYEQFIQEMSAFTKKERMTKREGLRQIVALLKDGDAEAAKVFYHKFNDILKEQEFSPMVLHPDLMSEMGLEQEAGESKADEEYAVTENAVEEAAE